MRARVTLLERDLALKGKQNENLEVQVNILAEKNRNLENIERKDFSHQFLFVDPLLSKLQVGKEKLLFVFFTFHFIRNVFLFLRLNRKTFGID